MRNGLVWLALIGFLTGLICSESAAAPFEPLFQVVGISGSCKVSVPGSSGYVDTQVGKAYPYGTTVVTAPESSVTLAFSSGNTCELLSDTTATLTEDSTDPNRKAVNILKGKILAKLDKEYTQANTLDVVTRCASVQFLVGGEASIDAKSEADLKVAIVTCQSAQLGIVGPSYTIPLLEKEDSVTVACSDDRGFIRIRDLVGDYDLQVQDEQGGIRIIQMIKDSVVKILRKPSDAAESIMIVTILEIAPDGEFMSAQTVTEERQPGDEPGGSTTQPPPSTGGEPGETFPPTSSSTTTTTTTTTIPSFDTTTTTGPTVTTTTRRRTTTTTKKDDDRPDMTDVGWY